MKKLTKFFLKELKNYKKLRRINNIEYNYSAEYRKLDRNKPLRQPPAWTLIKPVFDTQTDVRKNVKFNIARETIKKHNRKKFQDGYMTSVFLFVDILNHSMSNDDIYKQKRTVSFI